MFPFVVHADVGAQDPHVPLLQHWPEAQQVVPHATPAPVHPATAAAHVDFAALAQAVPPWQHALPHFVVPAGQPHVLVVAFAHATPALQQHDPHRVVPAPHGSSLAVVAPVQLTLP